LQSSPNFIFDITLDTLEEHLGSYDKYRFSQILNWVYKKFIFSPHEMTNLPLKLKEEMLAKFVHKYPNIVRREKTSDKTIKYLLNLYDRENIEFVLINTKKRKTLCLSSQVGCPIRCKFCASGALGLTRSLFPGEITAQFLLGSKLLNSYPDNIVFMGIGEPLLNLSHLIKSLNIICSPEYINYATRRITISTSGIPKGIIKLADLKKQWNLAVSIHAPNDKTRAMIIPDNSKFPLQEILDACKYYFEKTGRIITFEYTLIKGINDMLSQADELAKIAKKLHAKINLIPYNPTSNSQFVRPNKQTCNSFANRLKEKGANTTFRIEKGGGINAACGQLRATNILPKDI
jgi:23S rRNA (adenine2503-C2)-methyltransferase